MLEQGTPVVASVTPIGVARDSRTFKQAASIARLGMRSLVVEGEASAVVPGEAAPAFELISIGAEARIAAPAPP
ncbi:MAG: hypothetical protein FJW90_06155, partial [Actinobacteria bacterium]|nr:hypothetical protein [Actinomycetota bacterium]